MFQDEEDLEEQREGSHTDASSEEGTEGSREELMNTQRELLAKVRTCCGNDIKFLSLSLIFLIS